MQVELTVPQQQALDAKADEPLRVVDPRTKQGYVLVRSELYDRIKELLEEEEDRKLQKAWLETATKARRAWVKENPY